MTVNKMILILMVMAIGYIHTYAQSKSTLSLTIGPAMPIGNFAQKDSSSYVGFASYATKLSGSGMAKLGYSVAGEYQYKFKKKFGLSVKFRWQQNPVNAEVVKQYLLANNTWANAAFVSFSNWTSSSLLVGGYYLFPSKNKKIDVNLKLLVGVLKTALPKKRYALTNFPLSQYASVMEESKPIDLGFAFLASAGMTYHLNKKFDLLANVEYADAFPPSPPFDYYVVSNQTFVLKSTQKVPIHLSTINLNIGVGFKF